MTSRVTLDGKRTLIFTWNPLDQGTFEGRPETIEQMNTGMLSVWVLSMILVGWATTEAQTPPPPSVTAATLLQVASSLHMYVDELPQIPKLFGYTMVNGVPRPANLTIGMYETTWVRLLLSRKYFLLWLHNILILRWWHQSITTCGAMNIFLFYLTPCV